MASCPNILDWKCIFVNELFGSVALAVIGAMMIYFLVAGRLRLGAELTLAVAFPIVIIGSIMISGFLAVYAFATLLVAWMISVVIQKIIGNK